MLSLTSTTTFLWEHAQKKSTLIWESQEKCKMHGQSDLMKEQDRVNLMGLSIGKLSTLFTQPIKEKRKLIKMKNARNICLTNSLNLSQLSSKQEQSQQLTHLNLMTALLS